MARIGFASAAAATALWLVSYGTSRHIFGL
jgi:hypothetical protein